MKLNRIQDTITNSLYGLAAALFMVTLADPNVFASENKQSKQLKDRPRKPCVLKIRG